MNQHKVDHRNMDEASVDGDSLDENVLDENILVENGLDKEDIPLLGNARYICRGRQIQASRNELIPIPLDTNHFNMGRRNGSCHFRHSIDVAGTIIMQAFQTYELRDADGSPVPPDQFGRSSNGCSAYSIHNIIHTHILCAWE